MMRLADHVFIRFHLKNLSRLTARRGEEEKKTNLAGTQGHFWCQRSCTVSPLVTHTHTHSNPRRLYSIHA